MDLEPWRYQRMDRKKWRCSRDAVQDQKYYECHMHRGCPHSRKLVEVGKTKLTSANAPPSSAISTQPPIVVTTTSLSNPFPSQSSRLFPKDEPKFPFQPLQPNKEPRCLDWIHGNNEEMESSLQWELMRSKSGMSSRSGSTPILQNYEDQLNSSYTAFLNPDLFSLDEDTIEDHRETTRSLILLDVA